MNLPSPNTPRKFRGSRVPNAPQVSIVTPAFNALPYLKKAIQSVEELGQTTAVEHVVADGASQDGSVELLQGSPLVRGISQPDNGLYAALNWTLRTARAPYIQWMNADDRICPSFTARSVDLLARYPRIDAVVGSTVFLDENNHHITTWRYDCSRIHDPWAALDGYFFNFNSAVFRTDLLRAVGEFDQRQFPIAADRHFQMKLLQQSPHIVVLNEPAYFFRQHPRSLTTGRNASQILTSANINLYTAWSQDPTLHPDLRRGFEVMATELQLGWHLKCLRTGQNQGRATALLELIGLWRSSPDILPAAIPLWIRKWATRGKSSSEPGWR